MCCLGPYGGSPDSTSQDLPHCTPALALGSDRPKPSSTPTPTARTPAPAGSGGSVGGAERPIPTRAGREVAGGRLAAEPEGRRRRRPEGAGPEGRPPTAAAQPGRRPWSASGIVRATLTPRACHSSGSPRPASRPPARPSDPRGAPPAPVPAPEARPRKTEGGVPGGALEASGQMSTSLTRGLCN